MSLVNVVSVVHMRVRVRRVTGRRGMDTIIALVRTMGDPCRPRNLEGQYSQQEQQYEM